LIYSSVDTVDWVAIDTPYANEVIQCRFVNGKFLAVGFHGNTLTSSDGMTWSIKNVSGDTTLRAIASGKGRTVVAGDFVVAVSTDGQTWLSMTNANRFYDLQFCDGWFVAATDAGVLLSRDGVVWDRTNATGAEGYPITLLTYDRHILIGASGIGLLATALNDSEQFKGRLNLLYPSQIEFFGSRGSFYSIESSANLIDWTPASDESAGSDEYLTWEAPISDRSTGFWRVKGVTR
jgi:hypothetical protein